MKLSNKRETGKARKLATVLLGFIHGNFTLQNHILISEICSPFHSFLSPSHVCLTCHDIIWTASQECCLCIWLEWGRKSLRHAIGISHRNENKKSQEKNSFFLFRFSILKYFEKGGTASTAIRKVKQNYSAEIKEFLLSMLSCLLTFYENSSRSHLQFMNLILKLFVYPLEIRCKWKSMCSWQPAREGRVGCEFDALIWKRLKNSSVDCFSLQI